MEPLGRWECVIDGRTLRVAADRDLGPVSGGRRYAVRDVTSALPPDDPNLPAVVWYSAEVLDLPDAADRERLRVAVEVFRNTPADAALVRVVGFGPVVGGGPGEVLLLTEPWEENLADRLARDRSLPDAELNQLYLPLAMGLFRLHERGATHAGLTPAAVVRTGEGWRLGVGRPTRDGANRQGEDVAGFGRVCADALGNPRTPSADWGRLLDGCRDPDPRRRWTAARLLFGPADPPAVADLTAEPVGETGTSYRVSWSPAVEGRFALHDWPHPHPPPAAGEVWSWARLGPQLGPAIPLPGRATDVVVSLAGPNPERAVVGVSVYDDAGLAVVGGSGRLTRVRDVREVKMTSRGGQLILKWRWPDGISTAAVAVRSGRFPAGPHDAFGLKECLRSEYENAGFFTLPLPPGLGGRVCAAVFAAAGTPGRHTYAPGLGAGARASLPHPPVAVRYTVRPTPRPELVLTATADCTLPPLVLVGDRERPYTAADGNTLLELPGGTPLAAGRPLVLPFDRPDGLPRATVWLFCRQRSDYDWLELLADPTTGPTF